MSLVIHFMDFINIHTSTLEHTVRFSFLTFKVNLFHRFLHSQVDSPSKSIQYIV